jgi:transcriptional regulator with XRE-family HTH domain
VKPRPDILLPHLRAWRAHRLMSQVELARRSRVHFNTISNAERGRPVRLVSVARLAKALDIDRRTLVYDAPQNGGIPTV